MTGTATTSAEEFYKVYGLDVVVVPTNRSRSSGIDDNDLIFQTEAGKFKAIARDSQGAARKRPAGPDRHRLDREERNALGIPARRKASRTRSSTPKTTSAKAR